MANGLGLIFLAVYVLGVAIKGNVSKLGTELATDKGFVPWLVAFAVLWYIAKNKTFGDIGNGLLMLAGLGFLLTKGDKVFTSFSNFFTGSQQ